MIERENWDAELEKEAETIQERTGWLKHVAETRGRVDEYPAASPGLQNVRSQNKVGRNDACPCGSAKKYKNCHGAQS